MTVQDFLSNKTIPFHIYNGDCYDLLRSLPDESVDLTVTSPPYFMGKEYDRSKNLSDFREDQSKILREIVRITKPGGSICWQVWFFVKNQTVVPLDFEIYSLASGYDELFLRNRIMWTFGHGFHTQKRFSGRHETILWFTKGDEYVFDLDSVRIPQKYPGKKYSKWEKKGEYSGNPMWKNPSDVWDIPNVKAHHVEKTDHPCQFPIALAQRLVLALSKEDGVVLDPYLGSGSTWAAALLEWRRFVGAELDKKYSDIALKRCNDTVEWKLVYREDRPILKPDKKLSVAKKPSSFL